MTTNDLKVFITNRDSQCDECKEGLGRHAWITLEGNGRDVCLSCADLDHLVFLPSGDAALTRRARKHSRLSAVVLKWSRTRKRYERQGLLVEDKALTIAEAECEADAATRAQRRERAAVLRKELDQEYVARFAARIRDLYPDCPEGRENEIAEHACRKYSGRVGRTSEAKDFDPDAIRLALIAHIRHAETPYDELLLQGHERHAARARVRDTVDTILRAWKG
ncbi:DUF2293 domain-containing protein [Thiohalocapsa marina]|uniref:DUF2293 domain-containing protein n=1 Tax=Thiohalocapsa marina TaxID=424902 RepID=A0A5M8FM66_9GAMM|nr:DUF2293 domain-containing protein [Thiohalocapsa marina]KAA6184221.1 DUF2293 domain-containing protein [Thiohalocapsa marina]